MVDSIKNMVNRVDVQRARINDSGTKSDASSLSSSKSGASKESMAADTSTSNVSEQVAKLAKQPPIDNEAVSRIKNAIADGKYPIDIDAVSDALMDAYREMKS